MPIRPVFRLVLNGSLTFSYFFDLLVVRCEHDLESQDPDHGIDGLEDREKKQRDHSEIKTQGNLVPENKIKCRSINAI